MKAGFVPVLVCKVFQNLPEMVVPGGKGVQKLGARLLAGLPGRLARGMRATLAGRLEGLSFRGSGVAGNGPGDGVGPPDGASGKMGHYVIYGPSFTRAVTRPCLRIHARQKVSQSGCFAGHRVNQVACLACRHGPSNSFVSPAGGGTVDTKDRRSSTPGFVFWSFEPILSDQNRSASI